ncbi:MAG: lysine transporter LysE [Bacteroidia bacterium]|nr:MAG: lysine transporter LysE [Bacteroidia bacterium]
MIFSLIYQSIIIIVLLTFSFGPSFFSLINYSIKKGFRPASMLAFGVVGSDFFVCLFNIFLVHYGFTEWLNDTKNQRFAGILAGVILILFGAFYFKKEAPSSADENGEDALIKNETHPALLIVKGFILNLFNPAVWFLWLGNVTIISNFFNHSLTKTLLYFSIINGIVLIVELYKIYLGNKIKKVLKPQLIHIINILTGSTLIAFGIYLIYNYYFEKI